MAHHFGLLVVLLLAPVFLALLPWPVAIVACLVIAASAGLALAYASRALEAPVTTGREAMLGGTVEVLGRVMAGWQVRYYSEIWSLFRPTHSALEGRPESWTCRG